MDNKEKKLDYTVDSFKTMTPKERMSLLYEMQSANEFSNMLKDAKGNYVNAYTPNYKVTQGGPSDIPTMVDTYIKNFTDQSRSKGDILGNYWLNKKEKYMREIADNISKNPEIRKSFTEWSLPKEYSRAPQLKELDALSEAAIYKAGEKAGIVENRTKTNGVRDINKTIDSTMTDQQMTQTESMAQGLKDKVEAKTSGKPMTQYQESKQDIAQGNLALGVSREIDRYQEEKSIQQKRERIERERPFEKMIQSSRLIESLAEEKVKGEKEKWKAIGAGLKGIGKVFEGVASGYSKGRSMRRGGRGSI